VANITIQTTSTSQLFTNVSDDSYTPTCLMAKGDKVNLFNVDFTDDDDKQLAMKNKMIKEFGLNGYCWGLVLKCYELRTRQHKMLMVKALHPSKHYLP
jgi:hypothetical protein